MKTALDTVNDRGRAGYLIVTPLVIAAMLFVYKARSSLRVLRATWASGTIGSRPVPLALPTFLEIPLALSLLAGLPWL